MSAPEKQTRYNELLGVPNAIRDPDLYQLLGIDRAAFDASEVEDRYRERMSTLQAIKSPKHKSFIEFLKGELRRARSTLCDARQRAAYDEELLAERREQLTRILEIVLADGSLAAVEEERIHALALEVGLFADETTRILDEELQARGARREAPGGVWQEALDPAGSAPPGIFASPPPASRARALPGGSDSDTSWLDSIAPPPPAAGRAASKGDVADAIARRMSPAGGTKRRAPLPPVDDPDEVVAELVDSGEASGDDARVRHLVGSDDLLPTLSDSGEAIVAELVEPAPLPTRPAARPPEPPAVGRTSPRTGALARREPPAATSPAPLRTPTPDRAPDRQRSAGDAPAARSTAGDARSTERRAREAPPAQPPATAPPAARSTERREVPSTAPPSARSTERRGTSVPPAQPPLESKPRPRPASGWGKAAADRPAGVCSSCLGEVGELDITSGKAERTDEGRLHCPRCLDQLVAGFICCACYQQITRSDRKSKRYVVLPTNRVAHGHCAR